MLQTGARPHIPLSCPSTALLLFLLTLPSYLLFPFPFLIFLALLPSVATATSISIAAVVTASGSTASVAIATAAAIIVIVTVVTQQLLGVMCKTSPGWWAYPHARPLSCLMAYENRSLI